MQVNTFVGLIHMNAFTSLRLLIPNLHCLLLSAIGLNADIIVADSATEFSGVHGSNNWYYGYWQKTGDLDNCDNAATDFVSLTRRGRFLQLTMSEGRSSLQGFDNG